MVRCHVGAGRVTAGPGKKTPQTVRRQNISSWVLLQDVVMLFIILASPKHLLVFMKGRCRVSKKIPVDRSALGRIQNFSERPRADLVEFLWSEKARGELIALSRLAWLILIFVFVFHNSDPK